MSVTTTTTTLRKLDEELLMDQLLADFSEELRASGITNYEILQRCPEARRQELRGLMNTVALMHWAAERARSRGHQPQRVGK